MTAPDGTPVTGKFDIVSDMRIDYTPDTDVTNASIVVKGRVEKKPSMASVAGRYFIRALMMVRNVSGTYTRDQGHILPGYLPGATVPGTAELRGHVSARDGVFWQARLMSVSLMRLSATGGSRLTPC